MGQKKFRIEFEQFVNELRDPVKFNILVYTALWTRSVDIYWKHMNCSNFEEAQTGIEKFLGKTAQQWIGKQIEKHHSEKKILH